MADWTSWWWKLAGALVTVITLFGGIYGFQFVVEKMVDNRLQDPAVLQELANQIRPALIFDQTGKTVSNLGAFGFIRRLEVSREEGTQRFVVLISFNEYFAAPPNLECMDSICTIEVEREGLGSDWRFEVEVVQLLAITETSLPEPSRFRLEIVR